jgi:hypothetical protein
MFTVYEGVGETIVGTFATFALAYFFAIETSPEKVLLIKNPAMVLVLIVVKP